MVNVNWELRHIPPGSIGGSKCFCPCTGDPLWNTPEKIEKDLQKLLKDMADYREATKNINIGQY